MQVLLTDENGRQAETTVTVMLDCPNSFPGFVMEVKESKDPPEPYIGEIDRYGVVSVLFDR